MTDLMTIGLVGLGVFFFVSGALGLLRFPNTCARLHALTKVDNLGLGCIALGVVPQLGQFAHIAQVLVIWVLTMLCGAAGAYLIARRVAGKASRQ